MLVARVRFRRALAMVEAQTSRRWLQASSVSVSSRSSSAVGSAARRSRLARSAASWA